MHPGLKEGRAGFGGGTTGDGILYLKGLITDPYFWLRSHFQIDDRIYLSIVDYTFDIRPGAYYI